MPEEIADLAAGAGVDAILDTVMATLSSGAVFNRLTPVRKCCT
jgi:hypothetical protein